MLKLRTIKPSDSLPINNILISDNKVMKRKLLGKNLKRSHWSYLLGGILLSSFLNDKVTNLIPNFLIQSVIYIIYKLQSMVPVLEDINKSFYI